MSETGSFASPLRRWLCLALMNSAASFVAVSRPRNRLMISQKLSSTTMSENLGIIKTVEKEGVGVLVNLGDIATVKYACYVQDSDVPFAKSSKEKFVVGDGTMIDGWERAIRGMQVGERSIIRIENPEMAYGTRGIPALVPPNAVVELDLEILDAQAPTANIDFDNLALDSTPTTAADIARAFEARQAARAGQVGEKKEGIEAFIEKIRTSYFYGLFEGETGQEAPWYLKPSITFPLAFLVVGVAFYISFAGGAITERGTFATDELDEIVLSSNALFTIALSMPSP